MNNITKSRVITNLDLLDRCLSLFLKLSPLGLFLGASILWEYLRYINRIDLFLPSISSPIGIVTILIGYIVLSAAILFVVLTPSFLTILAFSIQNTNPDYAFKYALKLLVYAPAISATLMIGFLYLQKNWLWIASLTPIILFAIILLYQYIKNRKFNFSSENCHWGDTTFLLLFLALASVSTIYPAYVYLVILQMESNSLPVLSTSIFIALLCLISLAPGIIYVIGKSKSMAKYDLAKNFSIAALVVLLAWLFVMPKETLLKKVSLLVGIRDNIASEWVVKSNIMQVENFEAEKWSTKQSPEKDRFYIKGLALYRFSEIILLCPKDIFELNQPQHSTTDQCVSFSNKDVIKLSK